MAKKKLAKSYRFEETGRQSVPVTLVNAEGEEMSYVIEEMNGTKLADWREYQLNGDKKYYHASLIEKCLKPIGEFPKLTAQQITERYYSSIILRLFEVCSHVNGFMDEIEMGEDGEPKKE